MTDIDLLKQFEESMGNPGKALSRMIRPTFVAPEKKTLVWGDYSNIEARGLPWLAKAEERLDIFREIDEDPANTPDVYLQAAAGMYGHNPHDLLRDYKNKVGEAKELRQKGKIAELALGFAGGPGALQSMAANYGMAFTSEEAKEIVERWRAANSWAEDFWTACKDAFYQAVLHPDVPQPVGRVVYQAARLPDGELWVLCFLPDGRPLFYRDVRKRVKKEYDPFDPTVVIEENVQLSFTSDKGIKWLWRGLLVENITQAACASVLRDALVHLENNSWEWMPIVGHTHDEIITLTDDDKVKKAKHWLYELMLDDWRGWRADFPLEADVTSHKWYSKAIED